ncbi:hypothetical protein ACFL27_06590 [candidate division CSSED10-310 bacterium]|uniref:Uncharacterized protein n=1 Tax=candidate division CSSED10-310 bacterium TaxID=2855610 RepID=A0ABV6YUI8_UNCC1
MVEEREDDYAHIKELKNYLKGDFEVSQPEKDKDLHFDEAGRIILQKDLLINQVFIMLLFVSAYFILNPFLGLLEEQQLSANEVSFGIIFLLATLACISGSTITYVLNLEHGSIIYFFDFFGFSHEHVAFRSPDISAVTVVGRSVQHGYHRSFFSLTRTIVDSWSYRPVVITSDGSTYPITKYLNSFEKGLARSNNMTEYIAQKLDIPFVTGKDKTKCDQEFAEKFGTNLNIEFPTKFLGVTIGFLLLIFLFFVR